MSETQLIILLYLLVFGRVLLHFKPDLVGDRDKRKFFAEYADSLVTAGVAALLLITFVVRSFYIPSASMVPTLLIKDFILVNEMVYRMSDPARGDIVVFRPPHAEGQGKDYIKRIVAVENDVIEVREGQLYRNGELVEEPFTNEELMDRKSVDAYRVPPDHVFVMGDNRNNSLDSRVWGPLPVENIVGRAELIFFPPSRIGLLE